MRWFVASLLLTIASQAFALREGATFFQEFQTRVRPYLAQHLKLAKFRAFDGKSIVIGRLEVPNTRGTIFISPGRTESIVDFSEIIYDLAQDGFSIAIIDHRGQGFSDRIVTTTDVGTVDHFSDYTNDFTRFVNLVKPSAKGPLYLLADSMGGAIALDYLTQNPSTFVSAVVAVPMLKIATSPLPFGFARMIADTYWFMGWGTSYIPMAGPFRTDAPFQGNSLTDSQQRFDLDLQLTAEFPRIAVGGASINWLLESMIEGARLRKLAAQVTTPLTILQAGRDQYVVNSAENKFCDQAPRCTLVRFPTAQHWIFMSGDETRDQIFSLINARFSVTKAARDLHD